MSELSPRMLALKANLGQAIRRDHRRRQRRSKAIRLTATSMVVALACAGSALAAGRALGLIDLGSGATAVRIHRAPSRGPVLVMGFTGCPRGSVCSAKRPYVYRVSGGHASRTFGGVTCEGGHGFSPHSMYVSSSRKLSASQLKDAINMVDGIGHRSLSSLPRGTMIEIRVCHEAHLSRR